MVRWPTLAGLWTGAATWTFAVLAVVELRGLDRDVTAPTRSGYVVVPEHVPALAWIVVTVLGVGLVASLASPVSGRGRRPADLLLAVGLVLGGGLLGSLDDPRPVGPVLLIGGGLVLAVTTLTTGSATRGRWGSLVGRLLLGIAATLLGLLVAYQLDRYHWQLQWSTREYWAGLGVAVLMLLISAVWPRLPHRAWRALVGVPLGLFALLVIVFGVAGLLEGYVVSGYEEDEDGWSLGGPPLFLGTGLLAAALAAMRGRWSLAAGTAGAAVLVLLAMLFGMPEIRAGL